MTYNPRDRRTWPCEQQPGGCICPNHNVTRRSRRHVDHRRLAGKPRRREAWSDREIAALHIYMKERVTINEMALDLNKRFKTHRTDLSVRNRLFRLGLLAPKPKTVTRTRAFDILGITQHKMRKLIDSGVIKCLETPTSDRRGIPGTGRKYVISHEELKSFIDQYAGIEFDVRDMPKSEWRSRAEVAAIANRRRSARIAS